MNFTLPATVGGVLGDDQGLADQAVTGLAEAADAVVVVWPRTTVNGRGGLRCGDLSLSVGVNTAVTWFGAHRQRRRQVGLGLAALDRDRHGLAGVGEVDRCPPASRCCRPGRPPRPRGGTPPYSTGLSTVSVVVVVVWHDGRPSPRACSGPPGGRRSTCLRSPRGRRRRCSRQGHVKSPAPIRIVEPTAPPVMVPLGPLPTSVMLLPAPPGRWSCGTVSDGLPSGTVDRAGRRGRAVHERDRGVTQVVDDGLRARPPSWWSRSAPSYPAPRVSGASVSITAVATTRAGQRVGAVVVERAADGRRGCSDGAEAGDHVQAEDGDGGAADGPVAKVVIRGSCQGRMMRSKIRPAISQVTAARPQLSRAFLVSAFLPWKLEHAVVEVEDAEVELVGGVEDELHQVVGAVDRVAEGDQERADGQEERREHAHQPDELGEAQPDESEPALALAAAAAPRFGFCSVSLSVMSSATWVPLVSGVDALAVSVPPRGRQRPTKRALPGPSSTNDRMPMSRSSVANSAANCCRSISSPVSRSVSSRGRCSPWPRGGRTTRRC